MLLSTHVYRVNHGPHVGYQIEFSIGEVHLVKLAHNQQEGKTLHLRHLSPDCLELLDKAKGMVEVNAFEDPHYHIADNKLG